ncbi:hypothetical protein BS059_RS22505 [Vibrio parahaemolyticus]|nr:hypothetical protein [Vibrio parahaemolyticus]
MDFRTRILMEELLSVRSPLIGACTVLVPIVLGLVVLTNDIGYSLFINAPTAFLTTLILFMAMNELLSISNHLKTVKILKQRRPPRSALELITKDPNISGITNTQSRAIKEYLNKLADK